MQTIDSGEVRNVNIAICLDPENFSRYSPPDASPPGCTLLSFGNGEPDADALAASGAEVLIADPMLCISGELIRRMPKLRLIQSQGVGFDRFDLAAAKQAGVWVANCAGANASAVAEQAILLMLSVLRQVKAFDRMVYAGRQAEAKKQCFQTGVRELRDCHVGIVGYGAIGRALAERLRAFGSRLSYFDLYPNPHAEAEYMPFDQLLRVCDILSLHLPVTEQTRNLIDDEAIAAMRPGAILINTARGEIVDPLALRRALLRGHLAGAGLDTLSPEPVPADHPLLDLPPEVRDRVVLSPHIGGITEGSFRRYYEIIWDNVRRVAAGQKPTHIVN